MDNDKLSENGIMAEKTYGSSRRYIKNVICLARILLDWQKYLTVAGWFPLQLNRMRGVVEIFMKEYIAEIKEKTSGMSKKEVCIYVLEYYWYHILGIIATIALVLLFVTHYVSGNKKPVFTCVLVNQEMGMEEAQKIAKDFAISSGLPEKRVVISSDYTFSYGDVVLEGVNESSYEKFFFQWENQEIDAIVMPESFYIYIKEMGGMFREVDREITEEFETYIDNGVCTAIVFGKDSFTEKVSGRKDEKLLLAFRIMENMQRNAGSF